MKLSFRMMPLPSGDNICDEGITLQLLKDGEPIKVTRFADMDRYKSLWGETPQGDLYLYLTVQVKNIQVELTWDYEESTMVPYGSTWVTAYPGGYYISNIEDISFSYSLYYYELGEEGGEEAPKYGYTYWDDLDPSIENDRKDLAIIFNSLGLIPAQIEQALEECEELSVFIKGIIEEDPEDFFGDEPDQEDYEDYED